MRPESKKTCIDVVAAIFLMLAPTGCHKEYTDYETTAVITLAAPDSITVEQMQGTVTVTNLNNRQSYAASSFQGNQLECSLMRGVYSVSAEGSLRYRDALGQEQRRMFRASSSYEQVLDHPSHIRLNIMII